MTVNVDDGKRPLQTAAPSTPYHRLARTPLHRWWRPLVGTVVIAGFSLFLQIAPFLFAGQLLLENPTALTAVGLLAIAGALPATLLVTRWVQWRPASTLSSVQGRLRRRWLTWCAGAAVLYLIPLSAVMFAMPAEFSGAGEELTWVGWQRFAVPALIVLLLAPLQATAEEYVFRGWLLQGIGTYLRSPWPAVAGSSVLFALLHGGSAWAFVYYALFGAVLAALTVRTGGLEAGIALHVVNNTVLFLAVAATTGLDLSGVLTARAAVPWQFPLLMAVPLSTYGALVWWLAKRLPVTAVSGAP
ncbi:MAG: lysostaphin resistance A-like protein [Egibacteraceae bacterium]